MYEVVYKLWAQLARNKWAVGVVFMFIHLDYINICLLLLHNRLRMINFVFQYAFFSSGNESHGL